MRKRLATVLCAVALLFSAQALGASPATAAGSCPSYGTWHGQANSIPMFAGHYVRVATSICTDLGPGEYGPGRGIFASNKPVVSFPTALPGGLGETLSLYSGPTIVQQKTTGHHWRFTVRQGHVALPNVYQYFTIEAQYQDGALGRLCAIKPNGTYGTCWAWS